MKRVLLSVIIINGFLNVYAQSSTDYNYQGDQALQRKDYQTARSWYSEGLDSCNGYSIQKLVEIWINQPSMRSSMQLPMRKSFNCMKTLAETRNPDMMRLFSDFYKYGIGTPKDSTQYNYWYNEWWNIFKTTLDIAPGKLNLPEDSDKVLEKTPHPRRFHPFLTYTYSLTMPFGLTGGVYFSKVGGYVSYRNDFNSVNAPFECNNTQVTGIGVENPPYVFNREMWHSRMITGGLLYSVIKNRLFISAGGGYGKRDYYREIETTTDQKFSTGNKNDWCFNTEASYSGLSLEVGGMFVWKKLMVLGGVNSTQFKDLDIYFGLGLTF